MSSYLKKLLKRGDPSVSEQEDFSDGRGDDPAGDSRSRLATNIKTKPEEPNDRSK